MMINVAKFLAKVLGLYLLIVSSAIFFNAPHFVQRINALVSNDSVLFLSGFFTLIIGILMVVAHNIWQWHWRIMVTVIAWITLIKGTVLIFYPPWVSELITASFNNNSILYTGAAIDFILGLILVYFGFRTAYF